jgi:hypothetical protein
VPLDLPPARRCRWQSVVEPLTSQRGHESRTDTTSILRYRRAARAASSAWLPVAGGSTCAAVRVAAVSVVATRRPRSMRVSMPPMHSIRSSGATSLARTGSGTTLPSSTWRARSSLLRSITRSTSPCRDQPAACPQDGSGSCTDATTDVAASTGLPINDETIYMEVHHLVMRAGR